MPATPATDPATTEQRAMIDALCAALDLPSDAQQIASAAQAEAAIAELTTLKRRLCWRS